MIPIILSTLREFHGYVTMRLNRGISLEPSVIRLDLPLHKSFFHEKNLAMNLLTTRITASRILNP